MFVWGEAPMNQRAIARSRTRSETRPGMSRFLASNGQQMIQRPESKHAQTRRTAMKTSRRIFIGGTLSSVLATTFLPGYATAQQPIQPGADSAPGQNSKKSKNVPLTDEEAKALG